MEYIQLNMDDYIQCKNDIKNNLGTIVKSFVRIGWQLSRIYNTPGEVPVYLSQRKETQWIRKDYYFRNPEQRKNERNT